MLKIEYKKDFLKKISRIKSKSMKEQIKKQIVKIISNPGTGKPMRYARKGTREVRVSSSRLAYSFTEKRIIFLEVYHKDEQ